MFVIISTILALGMGILTIQSVIDYPFTNKYAPIRFYLIGAAWVGYFILLLISNYIANKKLLNPDYKSIYISLAIFLGATGFAIITYLYQSKEHNDSNHKKYIERRKKEEKQTARYLELSEIFEEDSTQLDGKLYFELAELVPYPDSLNKKETYYWKAIELENIDALKRICYNYYVDQKEDKLIDVLERFIHKADKGELKINKVNLDYLKNTLERGYKRRKTSN